MLVLKITFIQIIIMKNFISLLFIGMFINMSLAQTNTFTVYYFDAKPGTEAALANVYDDFFEGALASRFNL